MTEQFSRTEMLLGKENMERLARARVAVFGIGGVGGHVVEALARSGIGTLDLIDNDTVCESNLNRQIIALHSTLGMYKVDAARARILDINPAARVNCYRTFFLPDTAESFPFEEYDYVVDAIDTVTGKIELILRAQAAGTPVISSMGAGNKLDPAAFEVADIYKTSVCPLAKVMRRELKKRGVKRLKVVYSREEARTPNIPEAQTEARMPAAAPQEKNGPAVVSRNEAAVQEKNGLAVVSRNEAALQEKAGVSGVSRKEIGISESAAGERKRTPGSNAFVPAVAGLILAGEVVKDLCGLKS